MACILVWSSAVRVHVSKYKGRWMWQESASDVPWNWVCEMVNCLVDCVIITIITIITNIITVNVIIIIITTTTIIFIFITITCFSPWSSGDVAWSFTSGDVEWSFTSGVGALSSGLWHQHYHHHHHHHHHHPHHHYHHTCFSLWSFSSGDGALCSGLLCHHHHQHHHHHYHHHYYHNTCFCAWSFSWRVVQYTVDILIITITTKASSLLSPYMLVCLVIQFKRWCTVRWSMAVRVKQTMWRLESSVCWWMSCDTSTTQTAWPPCPVPFSPARRVDWDPREGGNGKVGRF